MEIGLIGRRVVFLAVLLAGLFFLNACALFDHRNTVTYGHNSKPVPEQVFNSIRVNKTTRDWVLENIGEPDQVSRGSNTSEIFTYRFEEHHTKRTRVFLLFSFKKNEVKEKHVFVHFVGGVVHKYWRDYELPALPVDKFEVQHQSVEKQSQTPSWSEPLDPLSEGVERY
jgi:hypothetical protein